MRIIVVLVVAALATACSSQVASTEEHIQKYIGSDIAEVQERYLTERPRPISFWESRTFAWQETQKILEDGSTLHAFKNPSRDCTINWIADSNGIIKSATSSGAMCDP